MAAVLACGRSAVLSHRSAAALWQLGISIAKEEPVDVTMVAVDRGCRPGICPHRVISLPAREVTECENIPVTTVARTLLDLAAVATSSELTQALAVAARTYDTQPETVMTLLSRFQRRPGARLLRAILAEGTPALTRSQAEEQLLGLIRKAQLPRPEVNAHIDRYEVDFLWKSQRLIVEVDGFAYHSSRTRFENDRRRDAALAAQGFRVMRLTWRQISSEPEATLVRLAQALTPGTA